MRSLWRSAVVYKCRPRSHLALFLAYYGGGVFFACRRCRFSDWIYRSDELVQHLEQAHRLVFGYGIVPWDYHYGARNWLAIMPAATTLKLLQIMGLGHPDYYVPAVKILNATLSMAVPAGLYFFLRRHLSEIAARAGFVFCCFWWEFLIFAPAHLAFPIRWHTHRRRIGVHGNAGRFVSFVSLWFLAGLGGMLRLQYAPVAGLLGLIYLLSLPPKRMPFFMLGVWRRCCRPMVGLFVLGKLVELLFSIHSDCPCHRVSYRRPAEKSFSITPVFANAVFFQLGLYAVLFFLGLWQWRKYWIPLLLIIIIP